ncbi:Helicase domain protein [Herbaspirillum frisingense GSF30]|uniref:Helicase domain protein n=1 Tax=Herbaspirillum frisingense GSF30 TaxID=864073 RepID=A0AAI9IEQ0_9BURK|nr:DEAD/DEAH box helicase [Herbaspirillum frisingense]EOA04724.1 Helicase domain protein [Herbaspirillum frisingense GSF30]
MDSAIKKMQPTILEGAVIADVVRAADLSSLYLVPYRHVDPHFFLTTLKRIFPDEDIRRTAQGVALSLPAAEKLWKFKSSAFKWSGDAKQYIKNRYKLKQKYEALVSQVAAVRDGDRSIVARLLNDDGRFEVLDEHQLKNVAAMTLATGPGLCLFDEQGAGKTVSMIYTYDELVHRNEVDFMLIVAPKSMVGEWPKDLHRFMDDTYRVSVAEGSVRKKAETLNQRPDVVITNFETAVSLERELEAFLRSFEGRAIIVVDESFFIKSADARRTLTLRRLREWCGRAYVLCGTPAPNSPIDLVQQISFVDFGLAFNGIDIPDDREAALPIVQTTIETRGLYLRNLKADVLPGLPTKSFQQVLVKMEAKQAELYRAALAALVQQIQATSDIEFKRTITNFLSQRSMLLQICSNPAAATERYDATPAKVQALDDILERLIVVQNEKVVLWSFYTRTIDLLMKRYERYGAVRYDGAVSSVEDRQSAVSRFQQDPNTKLFIANPAAAGAGLTLHSARFAIYESMSNQAAHYLQSLDRIHRRGQQRPVEYIVLICENSIEEVEYQRLLRKEQSAQSLLGDIVDRPLIRTTMLDETLALLSALPQDS